MRNYNTYFKPMHFNFGGNTLELESVERHNSFMSNAEELIIKARVCREHEFKETSLFEIKKVIFSDPATIVLWADGTKTVVKCREDDVYDEQTGLLLCMAKKMYGNDGKFNDVLRKWMPEEEEENPFKIIADMLHATLVRGANE